MSPCGSVGSSPPLRKMEQKRTRLLHNGDWGLSFNRFFGVRRDRRSADVCCRRLVKGGPSSGCCLG